MCDFCKNYSDNRIFGTDIPIKKCANETDLTDAKIMKNRGDKVPGIVFFRVECRKVTLISYFARCAAGSWWKNENIMEKS